MTRPAPTNKAGGTSGTSAPFFLRVTPGGEGAGALSWAALAAIVGQSEGRGI
jgi:hypothetical protein